jgi:hypothetical protein
VAHRSTGKRRRRFIGLGERKLYATAEKRLTAKCATQELKNLTAEYARKIAQNPKTLTAEYAKDCRGVRGEKT